jgi:hypothetical protein
MVFRFFSGGRRPRSRKAIFRKSLTFQPRIWYDFIYEFGNGSHGRTAAEWKQRTAVYESAA